MTKQTTDATFEQDVLKSEKPVLVDFWAPWCGPCRILGPVIAGLGERTDGKSEVYKLNVDENPETAKKYGIFSIPTVVIFREGQESERLVGVRPQEQYLQALAA